MRLFPVGESVQADPWSLFSVSVDLFCKQGYLWDHFEISSMGILIKCMRTFSLNHYLLSLLATGEKNYDCFCCRE